MATESALDLGHAVALLAAAVVAVPLFRRLGLGAVLGYLSAGLLIGPYGLGLFGDPEAILHVAELGVVLFLFLIGLEMRPSKLWALRREIFGLGLLDDNDGRGSFRFLQLVERLLTDSPRRYEQQQDQRAHRAHQDRQKLKQRDGRPR